MTDCNRQPVLFSSLNRQQVVADFNGGRLTSDAGGLLLREADRQLGLIRRLAACIPDPRDPLLTVHDQEAMLAQRIFGIALGYEDLNDHDTLRDDPLFSVLADKSPNEDEPLAASQIGGDAERQRSVAARSAVRWIALLGLADHMFQFHRAPRLLFRRKPDTHVGPLIIGIEGIHNGFH
jgi:hypothetical protein